MTIPTLKRYIKPVWWLVRWAVIFGVIGLMLIAIYQSRVEFGQALGEANWAWLGLAMALNLLGSLIYVTVWNNCGQQLGATGGFRGALVALSVAGAARYVPGGIWPVAGLVYFGPRVGLSRKLMPILAALAQLVHLLAAGLIGLSAFLLFLYGFHGQSEIKVLVAMGLALGLGLGTVAVLPRYLVPLFTLMSSRIGRALAAIPGWPPKTLTLWQATLRSVLFWIVNGVRLWVLALAFGPANFELVPYLIWVGAVTTILSAFFFFVPLGLGVIEFSLGWWLGLVLPWHQALALIAMNRLVRTLNDFFFLGLIKLLD